MNIMSGRIMLLHFVHNAYLWKTIQCL